MPRSQIEPDEPRDEIERRIALKHTQPETLNRLAQQGAIISRNTLSTRVNAWATDRSKTASSDARLVFEQGELSIGPLGTLYRRHGVECYRERREGPRWRPALLALLLATGATDNQRFGLPRSCLNALEGLGFLLNQLRHVLG